tara:strand:- start:1846 stop:2661 length:816 start_codon:yes stop_codon:yes gene_type:complete
MKNKKYGVMIATPCYGGQLTEAYLHGILSLSIEAQKKNIQIHLNTIGNESLITRARNTLVSQFLDNVDQDPNKFTHLMFIDSDIGFNPNSVIRCVESNYDISCGIYPRKSIDWKSVTDFSKKNLHENLEQKALGYNLNFSDPLNIKVKNGFTEVMDAATGFMCIKKEVFFKMKEAYPNLKYTSDQIINNNRYSSDNCYAFFDCIIDEKSNRYLSEDYAFCRLWQKIGGKIFADVISPLTHYGTYAFRGNVWNKFDVKEENKDGNDIQLTEN